MERKRKKKKEECNITIPKVHELGVFNPFKHMPGRWMLLWILNHLDKPTPSAPPPNSTHAPYFQVRGMVEI